MNWFNKTLLLVLATSVFSVQASVNVSLHQDLEILVKNQKNVGFTVFDNNQFTLENGQNQFVVRVSKLIIKQGEKQKFKSEPIVVTFNLSDTDLELLPERIFTRDEQVNGFDKKPVLIAKSAGKTISVEQGLLERGVGMSRDYAAELKAYNIDTNKVIAATVSAPVVANTTKQANQVTTQAVTAQTTSSSATASVKMSQDLFARASDAEKEQFTDWAFKNRKAIKAPLKTESRVLSMLEYWYEKANQDERAEILTWILAQ